jgi:hypothetical protein
MLFLHAGQGCLWPALAGQQQHLVERGFRCGFHWTFCSPGAVHCLVDGHRVVAGLKTVAEWQLQDMTHVC